jgi:hypothetical protein
MKLKLCVKYVLNYKVDKCCGTVIAGGSHSRKWEMLGMMRMELTSFYTVEVPVEWVEDVDAGVQITVKVLISLYQVHVVQL